MDAYWEVGAPENIPRRGASVSECPGVTKSKDGRKNERWKPVSVALDTCEGQTREGLVGRASHDLRQGVLLPGPKHWNHVATLVCWKVPFTGG